MLKKLFAFFREPVPSTVLRDSRVSLAQLTPRELATTRVSDSPTHIVLIDGSIYLDVICVKEHCLFSGITVEGEKQYIYVPSGTQAKVRAYQGRFMLTVSGVVTPYYVSMRSLLRKNLICDSDSLLENWKNVDNSDGSIDLECLYSAYYIRERSI